MKIAEEDMDLLRSLPQIGWGAEHPDLERASVYEPLWMQQMVGQESFKKYLKIDFVTCMFRAVRVE